MLNNAQKFAPEAWGMPRTFAPHLPRFCPAVFGVGQGSNNYMKTNAKTPCPTRGKSAGQTSRFSHLPRLSLPLGERGVGQETGAGVNAFSFGRQMEGF